jgi:hypothetical protein
VGVGVGVGVGFEAGFEAGFAFALAFAFVSAFGFAACVPCAGVFGVWRHRSDTGQRQHSGFSALQT